MLWSWFWVGFGVFKGLKVRIKNSVFFCFVKLKKTEKKYLLFVQGVPALGF